MTIKKYGPFLLNEKLTQEEDALNRVHGIVFITDNKNNDWYSLQKQFSDKTLKIVFDESGLINSASYDVSTLWPQCFYISEIVSIPANFQLPVTGGKWVFDGNAITEKAMTLAELVEQAQQTKVAKIAAATAVIAPLQDAVELGRASEAEQARLLGWKNYRVDLNQLDISSPSEIVWPESPQNVA